MNARKEFVGGFGHFHLTVLQFSEQLAFRSCNKNWISTYLIRAPTLVVAFGLHLSGRLSVSFQYAQRPRKDLWIGSKVYCISGFFTGVNLPFGATIM